MTLPAQLDSDLSAAMAASGPVPLTAYPDLPLLRRYRRAEKRFSEQFGGPDWPGADFDWPAELGLTGIRHVTVWDFDYYKLSMRVEGDLVLLQKHENQ